MSVDLQHLLAASALITHCERLCRSGRMSADDELNTRAIVAKARTAFSLGLPGECLNDNRTESDLDGEIAAVCGQLNSTETVGM
jgi:hypothetical protein